MSHDALKSVLEELPDPIYCEGRHALSERLAIALPDGDVGALDDRMFVDWLVEHAEDAPFGHNRDTKLDKTVRNAKRLRARGDAKVAGFDPADVLGEIEAALSPGMHLDAKLEDVIIYPEGGKFARHKDTPRTTKLVGTLVVGLPIAHQGGAFEITDRGKAHVVDWSGKPDAKSVRWVALFSDVDHAVQPIKSGARVTLVYSLSRSGRPRTDATRDKRFARLRAAASTITLAKNQPLMIACTRQVITDGKQPQSIEVLRGTDREIADALVDAGLDVTVRACIVGADGATEHHPFPDATHMWSITRLAKAIPAEVVENLDSVLSFTDSAGADEDVDFDASLLGEYVLDYVQMDRWILRKRAVGTIIYQGMYSETGYFGNEASDGLIYTLAALEVTGATKAPKSKISKQKPKLTTKAKPKAKVTATPNAKAKPKTKTKTKAKTKR